MLRQFVRNLMPAKNNLVRGVGSTGDKTDDGNSAFQRNRVSKEQQLSESLRRSLPGITYISVQDISGGCGAMFQVNIEATEFSGLPIVKQHRLVTQALKNEIADMHGIRINTSPPLNK